MPATRSELIYRAELQLPPRRADSAIPGRTDSLEETLLVVLDELPLVARVDDDVRRQLTKSVAFSLSAGSDIALTDAAFSTLCHETLDAAELYVAGIAEPASYYRDFFSFQLGTPKPGIARWCITESKIYVRAASSNLTASKACTLRDAIFTPTVSETNPATNTLPVGLEERVVQMMVARHLELVAGTIQATGGAS